MAALNYRDGRSSRSSGRWLSPSSQLVGRPTPHLSELSELSRSSILGDRPTERQKQPRMRVSSKEYKQSFYANTLFEAIEGVENLPREEENQEPAQNGQQEHTMDTMEKVVTKKWSQSELQNRKEMLKRIDDDYRVSRASLEESVRLKYSSYLFPIRYIDIPGEGRRTRGWFERAHIMLERPDESKMGFYYTGFMIIVILGSTLAYILETLPSMQRYKDGCDMCKPVNLRETDDPHAWTNRTALEQQCADCQPGTAHIFEILNVIAIVVFTVDYVLRLGSCWDNTSAHNLERLDSIVQRRRGSRMPYGWEKEIEDIARAKELSRHRESLLRVWSFITSPFNVVDLVVILPFYVILMIDGSPNSGALAVMRIVRLFRVLRLLKLKINMEKMIVMSDEAVCFIDAVCDSLLPIGIMFMFMFFCMLLCSSLMYSVEKGHWEPRTGRYNTLNVYHLDPDVPSYFESIPETFWWTLYTFTTLGYGTYVPTTVFGRFVGIGIMYIGLIMYTLPINMIGKKFLLAQALGESRIEKKRLALRNAAVMLVDCLKCNEAGELQKAFWRWRKNVARDDDNYNPAAVTLRKELRRMDRRQRQLRSVKPAMAKVQPILNRARVQITSDLRAKISDQLKRLRGEDCQLL